MVASVSLENIRKGEKDIWFIGFRIFFQISNRQDQKNISQDETENLSYSISSHELIMQPKSLPFHIPEI